MTERTRDRSKPVLQLTQKMPRGRFMPSNICATIAMNSATVVVNPQSRSFGRGSCGLLAPA